ncbi:MAG: Ger(x)C family spore germination protein [Oscillospiraceae bacterium]|jgi:spore germination protein KC|nr:Ger(x)C family spore germination protein [Oscillospiraceae bacterium]
MKNVVSLLAIVPVLLSSCGGAGILPRMTEISDFEVVQVIGVDKTGGNIEVTLVADRSAPAGGEGSSSQRTSEIVSFTGRTVVEAISQMDIYSDKRQHLGYVDFLLIGEEAARDGITKYIDFFTRDYESRYSANVFIIRDGAAKDFLIDTASEDRSINDALDNIDEAIAELSISRLYRIIDLVGALGIPYQAAIVPALICTEVSHSEMIGGEMPKKIFEPAGFAVIRDFKLAGYYDRELSPAYNYLIGKALSAPMTVKDPSGSYVALEIRQENLEFTATWDGDTLKGVKYDFLMFASLTEQLSLDDIYTEAALAVIADNVSREVEANIKAVIAKSMELGQDGFELGERVRLKTPLKWDKAAMDGKWGEVFPTLNIEVTVDTTVRRTYDLREPTGMYRSKTVKGDKK